MLYFYKRVKLYEIIDDDVLSIELLPPTFYSVTFERWNVNWKTSRSFREKRSHTIATCGGTWEDHWCKPGNAYGNTFYIDRKTYRAAIADSYHSCPRCEFLSKRSAFHENASVELKSDSSIIRIFKVPFTKDAWIRLQYSRRKIFSLKLMMLEIISF